MSLATLHLEFISLINNDAYRDHKPSSRPTWMSILEVLQSPDPHQLLQVDEGQSGALRLPPESLKLGSSNLNSSKNLHKDLQVMYTTLQVSTCLIPCPLIHRQGELVKGVLL